MGRLPVVGSRESPGKTVQADRCVLPSESEVCPWSAACRGPGTNWCERPGKEREDMTTLAKRLDVHFVACAAAAGAGLVGVAQTSEAAVIYSGVVNVAIPNTLQGIYLNTALGTTGGAPFAGWDINPYFNGGA